MKRLAVGSTVGIGPDPDEALPFDGRKGRYASRARFLGAAQRRHQAANAFAVVLPAMIAAGEPVAVDATQRERHVAVRAAVEEGADSARSAAEKDERSIEDRDCERFALQALGAAADIPAVAQAHDAKASALVEAFGAACRGDARLHACEHLTRQAPSKRNPPGQPAANPVKCASPRNADG